MVQCWYDVALKFHHWWKQNSFNLFVSSRREQYFATRTDGLSISSLQRITCLYVQARIRGVKGVISHLNILGRGGEYPPHPWALNLIGINSLYSPNSSKSWTLRAQKIGMSIESYPPPSDKIQSADIFILVKIGVSWLLKQQPSVAEVGKEIA